MHSTTNRLKATANASVWAGLDVSKETFDAALWLPASESLRDVPSEPFARTRQGVAEFLGWADGWLEKTHATNTPRPVLRGLMEATGKYSMELAAWLLELRPETSPAIVNPKMAKSFIDSLGLRNTTDKTASKALARYGVERAPAPYEPLTPLRAELRELCRYRQSLVGMRQAERNRASEINASALVRRMQKTSIRKTERDIKKIETEMARLVATDPDLHADCQALDGIFGIGLLTAITILAELGDLRRFTRARQLTAIAGLSPRRIESGTSVRKQTRMCKQGSSHVRRALYMPCLSAIRGDTELAEMYHRLKREGKKPKAALGAVMRKMLLVMRAILISGEVYQKHYRTCAKLQEKSA